MLYHINNLVRLFQASLFSILRIFVLIFILLFPYFVSAQNPVTEKPVAKNIKPQLIAKLPKSVNETSGLVFFSGMLWTINDSGNPPLIYQIDSITGEILRTVVIRNAVNTDWEAISHDDSNVYIGDFGNNFGDRTDLHILKIPKSAILKYNNDTVEAGFIRFHYPDQTSFERKLNNNNFDCEAFFYYQDSLHLFSKNWVDFKSKHYVVSSDTGTYQAVFAGQYEADGLITDASINAHGNIVLLGYKNIKGRKWECFCWLMRVNNSGIGFNGTTTRIELGSAWHLGQTEGIFLKDDNTAWLSSESIVAGELFRPAKLFNVSFDSSYLILRNVEPGNFQTPPVNSNSGE